VTWRSTTPTAPARTQASSRKSAVLPRSPLALPPLMRRPGRDSLIWRRNRSAGKVCGSASISSETRSATTSTFSSMPGKPCTWTASSSVSTLSWKVSTSPSGKWASQSASAGPSSISCPPPTTVWTAAPISELAWVRARTWRARSSKLAAWSCETKSTARLGRAPSIAWTASLHTCATAASVAASVESAAANRFIPAGLRGRRAARGTSTRGRRTEEVTARARPPQAVGQETIRRAPRRIAARAGNFPWFCGGRGRSGLRADRLPVGVDHDDVGDAGLLDALLHLRAVADDDPRRLRRIDHLLRRGVHLVERERAHLAGVGGPVVVGEAVAHDLRQVAQHRRVGLPRAGERERRLLLHQVELLLGGGARAEDLAQLLLHLDHRLLGLVGLHRRADHEEARPLGVGDRRARAVAPVLVLAQVHVDARRERPAQHAVHRVDGEVGRVAGRRQRQRGEDDRLRRLRLVDQVDHVLAGAGQGRADLPLRDVARLPFLQARLEQ